METTLEALLNGFDFDGQVWSYKFGEGYELCFEPLLWDNQMYVALYKDKSLLTHKIVVKPGKQLNERQ